MDKLKRVNKEESNVYSPKQIGDKLNEIIEWINDRENNVLKTFKLKPHKSRKHN